jgi:hypothetical protein
VSLLKKKRVVWGKYREKDLSGCLCVVKWNLGVIVKKKTCCLGEVQISGWYSYKPCLTMSVQEKQKDEIIITTDVVWERHQSVLCV